MCVSAAIISFHFISSKFDFRCVRTDYRAQQTPPPACIEPTMHTWKLAYNFINNTSHSVFWLVVARCPSCVNEFLPRDPDWNGIFCSRVETRSINIYFICQTIVASPLRVRGFGVADIAFAIESDKLQRQMNVSIVKCVNECERTDVSFHVGMWLSTARSHRIRFIYSVGTRHSMWIIPVVRCLSCAIFLVSAVFSSRFATRFRFSSAPRMGWCETCASRPSLRLSHRIQFN